MCREFYSNLDTRWNRSLYEKCMKIANEESTGLGFRNWRERQKRVKNSSEIWSSVTYTVLNSWKSSRFPFACQTVFHLGFTPVAGWFWLRNLPRRFCMLCSWDTFWKAVVKDQNFAFYVWGTDPPEPITFHASFFQQPWCRGQEGSWRVLLFTVT